MNPMLQSPLKLLTALFDTTTKTKKALRLARELKQEAFDEVNRLDSQLYVATVPDPVLHAVRMPATKKQLEAWQNQKSAAQLVFAETSAEVSRLEQQLSDHEIELSGNMNLTTVKAAYAQAKSDLVAAQQAERALPAKIKQATSALESQLVALERLRQAALNPGNDTESEVTALQAQREKITGAEMLVEILKEQHKETLRRVQEADKSLQEWEARLLEQVAKATFTQDELENLHQRIIRSYAAQLMSKAFPSSLYGYTLRLLNLDEKNKPDLIAAKAELRREYGMD